MNGGGSKILRAHCCQAKEKIVLPADVISLPNLLRQLMPGKCRKTIAGGFIGNWRNQTNEVKGQPGRNGGMLPSLIRSGQLGPISPGETGEKAIFT